MVTVENSSPKRTMWQQWTDRPEQVWLRQVAFQAHFWIGAIVAGYIVLMSLSGSVIVFRNDLPPTPFVEWLVRLHAHLGAGGSADALVAIGALSLIMLSITGAVIWWPGRAHWRRSLTIEWRARLPRITWDAHSVLGFWFFVFVSMWAVSGLTLSVPQLFNGLLRFDPHDRVLDRVLFTLAQLHFGRFNVMTKVAWSAIGFVPALLAISGVFICCRRVIWHKPSNPKHAQNAARSDS